MDFDNECCKLENNWLFLVGKITKASIHSFPGEEEDRTENIAVEIQPILRPN